MNLKFLIFRLQYKFRRIKYKLKSLFKFKKFINLASSFVVVGITLSIGSKILKIIREARHLDKLISKIDEKLMVKRFWLVGKAYKKVLEAE